LVDLLFALTLPLGAAEEGKHDPFQVLAIR
jgi:hypothetical protein